MLFKEFYTQSLMENFSFKETQNTDRTIEYQFDSKNNHYIVAFELDPKYGYEMSFGTGTSSDIDTRTLTNQPDEVIPILNTIFGDILKSFVHEVIKYDSVLNIILAPQLTEDEDKPSSPFESKRGKLYVRLIERFIKNDSFWNDYNIKFSESTFQPKSIILNLTKKT